MSIAIKKLSAIDMYLLKFLTFGAHISEKGDIY